MMLDPSADQTEAPDDEPDWGFIVTHATDWYWSELTDCCGGCGMQSCHVGTCPSDAEGYCTTCPERRATGQVRGVR